ncbi:chitinase [Actinocrinis puniceicyclus]|uniref:Chitinase n=1 Tax=Actinocrinis puniceicyclus TaxID=977794 RepID=A0A8J8BE82_9ACTN|nr:carbohydrate-binding protein [Actinocrinis puniceicyclus]MBS2965245.1 chitinase [Actinocrinis puniceicyclus]
MRRKQFTALGAVAAVGIATGVTFALATSSSAATSALPNNWYGSAPYVFVNDPATPDLGSVMDATGQKAFELAFILDSGGCTPSWNGTDNVSGDTSVGSLIAAVRAKGGDVSVSIGGYGGTKLGQDCGTPAATAAAYQQVVSKYSIHAMDFDLEEPEYENSTAIANELGAAQILQRDNAGLVVTVTMPGTTSGTGWFGTQLLDESKSLGFTPASFSIMPFDGGFNGGSSQTAALDAFHGLLETHMGWDSATAYTHEGVSMMNGRSDTGEFFYQSDFQTVLNYAENNHLGRYTFWDVNRDRQCNPPDNNGTTSSTCSSVPQNSWDFTKYTVQFAGATPPSTTPPSSPSASASPTGGTGGTCTAAAWVSTTAYNGGAVVSYNGHTWTAKWWTQGDIPGNNAQNVWTDDGSCGGGPSASPSSGTGSCTAAAWVSTTAYNGGAIVSYNGHTWTAKWWTQGDIPGNNGQNVWTDDGPC